MHKFVARNNEGTDYIIGDLHGDLDGVDSVLHRIGFDPKRDRLLCAGDLVDKGPKSHKMHTLLEAPWFFSVMGNHDWTSLKYLRGDASAKAQIGRKGEWAVHLGPRKREIYERHLSSLPLFITLETANGHVGIVHAECPRSNWFAQLDTISRKPKALRSGCLYGTKRFEDPNPTVVKGIDYIVAGHRKVDKPVLVGNHLFIETYGWESNGYFTILNADTLKHV